jgi:hypothetical protein
METTATTKTTTMEASASTEATTTVPSRQCYGIQRYKSSARY